MIGPRATELVAEAAVALRLECDGRGTDPHDPRASDDVGGGGRGRARRARRRDSHVESESQDARSSRSVSVPRRSPMATDVVMPQMGESIAEGTIVRWIKKVGDPIDKDEPLFEISTDKVDAEIPSPGAGVLLEIKVKEGETVPVNSVVAVIGAAGEKVAVGRFSGSAAGGPRRPASAMPRPPRRVAPVEPAGPAAPAVAAGPADAGRSAPDEVVARRAQDREGARRRHHAADRHRHLRPRHEEGHPRVRREAARRPRRQPPRRPARAPSRRRRRSSRARTCASRRWA